MFSSLYILLFVLLRIGEAYISPHHDTKIQQSCSNIKLRKLRGFQILSVQGVEVRNFSLLTAPSPHGLDFCNITVTLTHRGDGDSVIVQVWAPLEDWNGRYVATGGGGLRAGTFNPALAPMIARGFAASSTDAGLTLGNTIDPNTGRWALNSDGTFNTGLFDNFAYRSIHDMAVIGKAVIKAYYGKRAQYSYWNGCSTGGRQGYFEAQRHPEDFDGIVATAPAINGPQLGPAEFWPSVVMANSVAPPQCVFKAFQDAMIAACDPLDGVRDGLISDTSKCDFNQQSLVGTSVNCTGWNVTITQGHADIVLKILQGARTSTGEFIWYGNPPGAPFSGMANTNTTNGITIPIPFGAAEAWIRYLVLGDPEFDTAHITYPQFEDAFALSVAKYAESFGTDEPDLRRFRKLGRKMLTWHGLADPLITHLGTLRYREKLEKKFGGTQKVDEFYRLFLAPGAGHCSGGAGPNPTDPLSVLIEWVERGVAPETLPATTNVSGTVVSRNLCLYPRLLTYDGIGDKNLAGSFTCKSD